MMENGTSAAPGRRGGRPCAPENTAPAGPDPSPPRDPSRAGPRDAHWSWRPRPGPAPRPAPHLQRPRARDGDGWMHRDAEGTSGTPPGAGRARRPRPGHARPGSGAVPRFLFRLPRSRLAPVLVLSAFGPLAPPPSATQAAGGGGPPDARAAKLQATPRRVSGPFLQGLRVFAARSSFQGTLRGCGERLPPSIPWLLNPGPGRGVF